MISPTQKIVKFKEHCLVTMDVYGHLKIPVTGSFCKSTSDYGNHNKYSVISID